MAVEYGTIFYEKNVLSDLNTWTLVDAEAVDGVITIHANGYISTELSDTLNNGLKASKYRKIILGIVDNQIDETYNYQNKVELRQELVYVDPNGKETSSNNITPMVLYKSILLDSGVREMQTDLTMLNQELKSGLVTLQNNSGHDIEVHYVIMYRSNDLTGQLSGIDDGGGGVTPRPTQLQMSFNHENGVIDGINDFLIVTVKVPLNYFNGTYQQLADDSYLINPADGYPNARLWADSSPVTWGIGYNQLTLRGFRNGKLTIRYTIEETVHIKSEHLGEYIERTITVINCDRGYYEVKYDGAAEINGFNGTPLEIQMKPYPWWTYGYGINPLRWGSVLSDVYKHVGVSRGGSVDGGSYTFERNNNVGEIKELSGGLSFYLYGVWNGRRILKINEYAERSVSSTSTPDYTQDVVLNIVNCEHTIKIVANQNVITSAEQQVQVYLESDPIGVPVIFTQQNTSPYSWSVGEGLEIKANVGWGISRPYIMVAAKAGYTSGTYNVSVVAGTAHDTYETFTTQIRIDIPATSYTVSLENQVEGGTDVINIMGGELKYNIITDAPSPSWTVTKATPNTGWVRTSLSGNELTIDAAWDGDVDITVKDTKSGALTTKRIHIENNNSASYRVGCEQFTSANKVPGYTTLSIYLQGVNADGTDNEADRGIKRFNYRGIQSSGYPISSWDYVSVTYPSNYTHPRTSSSGVFYIALWQPVSRNIVAEADITVG